MVRLARWDVAASTLGSSSAAARDNPAMGRFAAPERGLAFWLALWALAIAAEFGALVPVIWPGEEHVETVQVIYRLIGGILRGVRADRVAPAARQPQRAADGRDRLRLLRLGRSSASSTRRSRRPRRSSSQELWAPFFVALLLTLLTGGRLESRVDWLLVGAFVLALWVMQVVWLLFYEQDGNLLAVFPNADIADAVDKGQRSLAGLASRRGRGRGRRCDGARRRAPRRRALLPSVAGSVALLLFAALLTNDLVTGSRSQTVLWLADLLARERAGGLPRRPAALAAGPRRPGRPLPRPQDHARGRAAGRRSPRRWATRASSSPTGCPSPWATPTPTGARCWFRRVAARSLGRDRRERRHRARRAGLRRLARRRSGARRGGPRRSGHGARERAPARRGAVTARRGAGLARAHRRGQRRRAPAAGAQPARRRAAAARRALAAAAPPGGPRGRRPVGAGARSPPRARELAQSLAELRELARGIHPAVLDHGLAAALDSLAARSPVPTAVTYDAGESLPEPVELAAYFVAAEALTNVAKYAQATTATRARLARAGPTRSSRSPTTASAAPTEAGGSGLRGLADRVEALDGRLRVVEPARRRDHRRRGAAVRVVIADDSVLVREGIAAILPRAGIDVAAQVGSRGRAARRRSTPTCPTSPSSTSACRRRRPTRGCARRTRSARATRRSASSSSPSTSRSGSRRACWPRPPRASATCSRTAWSTSTSSSARCERVADGGSALDPEVVTGLLARGPGRRPLRTLTEREREVLELIAEGLLQPGHRRRR